MDRFEEAKVKLMMKTRGIDRDEAVKILAGMNRGKLREDGPDADHDIGQDDEDRLMTAAEFFGED